ncbi:MAG: BTAD domain-containing putative transcriptional regulator [Frankiaceae bacterium]
MTTVMPQAAQRLVAYVALQGGAHRSQVAGMLWPEVNDAHADGSLRSTMWRVNKQVPHLLRDVGGTLVLGADVTVDIVEFTTNARRLTTTSNVMAQQEMLAHRGGELLPGWYDDWVVFERERLRQLRLHALDALADRLCDLGRYADALDIALEAVSSEPLRESAHRTIVRIHIAEGNAVEAVRAYRTCRRLLAAELGVAPSPAFQRLLATTGIVDA